MKKEVNGFGVGFRPPHYQSILETTPRNLDWLEVISENFMSQAPGPRQILEKLRRDYPVALHGVSLSIGSLSPFNRDYLKLLKELAEFIQPGIISDHLCWTDYGGSTSHDLLPMPYTSLSLQNVCERVSYLQDFLKTSILLENPSAYVGFATNEMSEAQFLSELCKKTGCGILLDVNNVYVNYKNLGADPIQYFLDLPQDAVKQFHLAGHSYQEEALIDTHDHPVIEEVWKLYELASYRWPDIPTLVEWDDKIPELTVLLNEVDTARKRHHFENKNMKNQILEKDLAFTPPDISLDHTYKSFFNSVTNLEDITAKSIEPLNNKLPVKAKKGLGIYKNAYFLRLESILKELFPTLHWVLEDEGFRELSIAYLDAYPPGHYSVTYCGINLPHFLENKIFSYDFGAPQSVLRDIAKLEWTRVELFDKPKKEALLDNGVLKSIKPEGWDEISFKPITNKEILNLHWDVGPVWESARSKTHPPLPLKDNCSYVVWQKGTDVNHLRLEKEEEKFLNALEKYNFKKVCEDLSPTQGLTLLLKFISEELIAANG